MVKRESPRTFRRCTRFPLGRSKHGTWTAAWRRTPCECCRTLLGCWLCSRAGADWPAGSRPVKQQQSLSAQFKCFDWVHRNNMCKDSRADLVSLVEEQAEVGENDPEFLPAVTILELPQEVPWQLVLYMGEKHGWDRSDRTTGIKVHTFQTTVSDLCLCAGDWLWFVNPMISVLFQFIVRLIILISVITLNGLHAVLILSLAAAPVSSLCVKPLVLAPVSLRPPPLPITLCNCGTSWPQKYRPGDWGISGDSLFV